MNEIEDKLYRHIYCDYRFGMTPNDTQTALYEARGLIPEIDSYVLCFREFVEEKIIPYIKDGGTITKEIGSMAAFPSVENPFFDSCRISVTATIRDGGYHWSSNYDQDESHYNKAQRYVKINVSASAPYEELLLSLLCSNFAHELTHAYDDFKSQTGGARPLKQVLKDTGYQYKLETWRLGDTQNKRTVGKMLYLMSRIELNAIIGQVSSEIQGKPVKNPHEALDAIKGTGAYRDYVFLKTNIDFINSNIDDMTKNDIASGYDWAVGEKLDFEAVKKKMNSMWRQWSGKFLNSIGKIAYDHYSKTQAPMWRTSDLP